ncbi:MAG: DUF4386 family protein [Aequorivita sp.]|nr:DUF4386 family protein [Aequorivita sp.]
MESNNTINSHLLKLGGIAGIVAGLCVLSFALISQIKGILFTPEVFDGKSIEPWLQHLNESPQLVKLIPILPIIGFSCMLVFGIVLYQKIEEKTWQKSLALVGYLIGVPIAVSTFVSHFSFVNELLSFSTTTPEMINQIQVLAAFKMHHYMTINFAIGPLFIIVIGNSFMAWAALKAGILPKWVCYWAFFNGSLIFLGIISVFFPIFRLSQIGGPLTMLWFLTSGIILIRKNNLLN